MSQYFKPYLYFNGEEKNPFPPPEIDPSSMFWDYEEHFDALFKMGDFSLEVWGHIDREGEELRGILDKKPVDKEGLFKLYMFYILMDRLPDRAQEPPSDKYLKMYHRS